MEKIVIVGSSGAGKSTLARNLYSLLRIKVFHIDRFFWQPDWKRETRDDRIDILQRFLLEKTWIIEGTYLNTSRIHLKAADTIIFLDIPHFLCFWRIIERHFEYHGRSRRDIPEGCTDKLTLLRMLKVLIFPLRERRKLKRMLHNYKSYELKQIIELHSSKEVEDFLVQLGASSGVVPATRTKLPVIAGR